MTASRIRRDPAYFRGKFIHAHKGVVCRQGVSFTPAPVKFKRWWKKWVRKERRFNVKHMRFFHILRGRKHGSGREQAQWRKDCRNREDGHIQLSRALGEPVPPKLTPHHTVTP